MANKDRTINYIELPLVDAARTKAFYQEVFGWQFQDWGDSYISFSDAGIEGGFNGESGVSVTPPGTLVVLYARDLPKTLAAVQAAGGEIVNDPYNFPGGRRFHFADPNGIELAVWTEADQ